MPAERVLTARQLNRALLARQLLLERVRTSVPRALEPMAGIQAQYAPAMYLGLWSRVEGFRRADLTRALEPLRRLDRSEARAVDEEAERLTTFHRD